MGLAQTKKELSERAPLRRLSLADHDPSFARLRDV